MLIRDGAGGVEVLLQRRPTSMKFAGGMYVFPGGRVEPTDADEAVPWDGPTGWEPFALRPHAAATASYRALTVAATRETWEEAGVLLAEGTRTPPQRDIEVLQWLKAEGLPVAARDIHPWVHWITPEVEERRFDTRFLIARMPQQAAAQDFGVETDHTVWMTASDALAGVSSGEMVMLPPTVDALQQLTDHEEVRSILRDAASRRPRPILPRPQRAREGGIAWHLVDGYTGEPVDPTEVPRGDGGR
jgi:8-oxo-dGTP pyrophosphatase MutT (NUDIX family)